MVERSHIPGPFWSSLATLRRHRPNRMTEPNRPPTSPEPISRGLVCFESIPKGFQHHRGGSTPNSQPFAFS